MRYCIGTQTFGRRLNRLRTARRPPMSRSLSQGTRTHSIPWMARGRVSVDGGATWVRLTKYVGGGLVAFDSEAQLMKEAGKVVLRARIGLILHLVRGDIDDELGELVRVTRTLLS
jgi:hypothetical protein